MTKMFKGPARKTYYDMNPWYSKNNENGVNDWHQHIKPFDDFFLSEIKQHLIENKPSKILEIACGGGNFTLSYANENVNIEAFEFSNIAIEMALKKENPFGIKFFQGDALNFESYKNCPYDLVIAKDLLHCLIGDDRKILFDNLKNSIHPKGQIFLSTHVDLPTTNEDIMKTIDLKTRINCIQTRVYLDKTNIEDELLKNGFSIINCTHFSEFNIALYLLEIIEHDK